jgi:hypothetical protein
MMFSVAWSRLTRLRPTPARRPRSESSSNSTKSGGIWTFRSMIQARRRSTTVPPDLLAELKPTP